MTCLQHHGKSGKQLKILKAREPKYLGGRAKVTGSAVLDEAGTSVDQFPHFSNKDSWTGWSQIPGGLLEPPVPYRRPQSWACLSVPLSGSHGEDLFKSKSNNEVVRVEKNLSSGGYFFF